MSNRRLDSINYSYQFNVDPCIGDLIKTELIELISNNPYFLLNGISFDINSYEAGAYSVNIEVLISYITLSPYKLEKIFAFNESKDSAVKKVESISIFLREFLSAYDVKLTGGTIYNKPSI